MKKLSLLLTLVILSVFSAYSQTGTKSILLKSGFQTDTERFGIGVEGRYNITDNIRFAPDVTFFFPTDHVTGLDFNANAHYVFPLQNGFSIYPMAGMAVVNNRVSSYEILGFKTKSYGNTDFSLNFGFGGEYELSNNSYLNAEFKYMMGDLDCAVLMVGFGFKF